MREVLELANECKSRDQLENLLGRPRYALDGTLYSRIPTDSGNLEQPEIVEVYELDNCGIELMFRNDRMIGMFGIPMPTSWEIVCNALPESAG